MAFPGQPEPQTSLNLSEPEIRPSRVDGGGWRLAWVALYVCAGCGHVCDAEAWLPFPGCGIELPSPEEVMQEGGPWEGVRAPGTFHQRVGPKPAGDRNLVGLSLGLCPNLWRAASPVLVTDPAR